MSEQPLYLDDDPPFPPGCWDSLSKRDALSLWIDSEQFITCLPTKKGSDLPNPYLGNSLKTWPYMGVPVLKEFPNSKDFSTPKGIYPQIIATYPQTICLDVVFLDI